MAKPSKNRIFCPYSNKPKMLFESEKKALNHIKFNASEYEEGKVPVRAYYCPACGGWHLTSQEKKNKLSKVFIVTLQVRTIHGLHTEDGIIISLEGNKVRVLTLEGSPRIWEFDQLKYDYIKVHDQCFTTLLSRIEGDYQIDPNLHNHVIETFDRCKSNGKAWGAYDIAIIAQVKAQDIRMFKTSKLGMYHG